MKKLILLLFLAPLFGFISPNVDFDKNIVGKRKGVDKGEVGYFVFDENGYAFMEMQGQKLGGENFVFEGKNARMTYKMNDKVNPMELDIIVSIIGQKGEHKLKFIVEFIDDDTIKLASDFTQQRPKEFSSNNTIVFKREK